MQEQLQQQEKTKASDVDGGALSKIKFPYVAPGQVSGLAVLERRRILEKGLELHVSSG